MPLIKARSSSIMNSVDLRGQPTAATADQTVNTNQLASTAFVRTAIANLVDSSPGLLDTLAELAAAIGNDENFATTIANSIATKVALDGSTPMTGELILSGAPVNNLGATTKQYVDDLVDNQMIYSTDDVPETEAHPYFSNTRARTAITLDSDNTSVLSYSSADGQFTYNHPTSDGILEGDTNKYYHTDIMRGDISMNSSDATIISYSPITGQFVFTTPNTDKIVEGTTNQYFLTSRARQAVSGGSNINYDSGTGIISTQAAVWSVNTQTGDVVLNTDNVSEGSSNKYFTNALAAGAISLTTDDSDILSYNTGTGRFTFVTPTTDSIEQGSVNQYYTNDKVRAAISGSGDISYNQATGNFSYSTPTTDGVVEGSNNKYFSNTLARNAISLTSDNTSVLDYDSANGVFTFSLSSQTTADVAEDPSATTTSGTMYYTDGRARAAIDVAGWSNLSYDDASGVITITAPSTADVTEDPLATGTSGTQYFTTARAQASVSATKVSGDGAFSYDNTTGVFSYTGPTNTNYRGAVSANHASGDGNLQYSSTTGVFTYDGPTNTNYRQAVSAYRDSGDGDLQYDSATGVFTYTGPSASETRVHFNATTSGTGYGNLTYDDATGTFDYAKVTSANIRSEFQAATSGTGFGGLTYSDGTFTYAKVTSADVRGEINATTATGVTYNSATGTIALASIPNSSLVNSDVTVNGYAISLGGSTTLNADDIAEAVGGTNKYFTEARFDTSLAGKTTSDVAEGSRLYYTQDRFDTAFAAKDTGDLAEDPSATGTSGTQYFTTARARNSLVAGTGVTYTAGTGTIAIGQAVGTTDNVTFNDVTVSGDLTVQGTLTTINSTTVDIADKNLTLAAGATTAAAADGAGLHIDGADANFFYSSGDNRWNVDRHVNVTGGVSVTTTMTATMGFVGDLTGNVVGNVTGDLTGNADTATALETGRDIQGVFFDGTSDITVVTAGTGVTVTGTAVAIGQPVATTDNVTFNTVTADLTGNVTGNVLGNVTGQVSDLSNHTTDDVTDVGATNQYLTPARVYATLSAVDAGGDGSFSFNSSTGAFTYTGPSASEVRAHSSATTSGTGFGDLTYNSTTGAFTYTKVTSSDIRGQVSATKSAGDGNFSYDNATGVFTYTGPDDIDYRLAISATKVSGDGNLTYDNTTGVISFTGPSAGDTRAHFSATTASGITYTQATGVFALASIPNSSLANSDVTVNGYSIALGGSTTLNTNDVAEGQGAGNNNLYFTDARARGAISLTTSDSTVLDYDSATGVFSFNLSGLDTSEVTEDPSATVDSGTMYFTNARARSAISATGWGNLSYNNTTGVINISAPSTANVTEDPSATGTSGTQYFTTTRARQAISLTTDNTDAMSYNTSTGVFTFTLATVDTDEIAEGPTNKYFHVEDARAAISNGANIDYDASTGVISTQAAVWSVNTQTGDVVLTTDDVPDTTSTNKYFTDAQARSAITLTSDNTDILSYTSANGQFTFVTPTTDAIDEGDNNLYYTNERADDRIAAASIRDLSDVDAVQALQDGYTLVWSTALSKFVPQNIAVTATTLNFTGDGTETSFSTGVNVTSIDNTQVYINGLIQAPTYSYTISTTNEVTSIVFDTAPEANDYIFVRVSSTSSLTAGGVLNESSNIDGGTY